MLTRIWSLSVALVVVSGLIAGIQTPASAADDEESMESIWADESQKPASKDAPKSKPEEVKTNSTTPKDLVPQTANPVPAPEKNALTEIKNPPAIFIPAAPQAPVTPVQSQAETKPVVQEMATETSSTPAAQPVQPNIQGDLSQPAVEAKENKPTASTAAPLSKLDEFNSSHFIKQGGWPGVGPFHRQVGAEDAFVDESGNALNLHIAGGRISQANFQLVNKGATYDDFLDLQVASDFLLEGLNIKPKTIIDFNQQLEDSKDNLLNLSNTTPVTINAGRYIATIMKQPNAQEGKFSFLISVVSKDASPDVIKEHSKESATTKENTGRFGFLNKQKQNPDFIIRQNQENEPVNDNNLTETFSKTIQSWQDIKKIAVRQRKTEELSQILAGKALIRQTEAIKWLSSNHKYYDMNPKGITVERFAELTPGQKYAVFVEIKEVSKLMDDANGQVLKEQDDSYKVNYTLEKINGHWYITDSAIVDKTSTPSASRPQGKTNR